MSSALCYYACHGTSVSFKPSLMGRFFALLNSTAAGVVAFAILGSLADIWSSWLVCSDSHVFESNPLTRDTNFKFVLSHGCWLKLIWLIFYGLTAAVIYKVMERYDREWAAIIASFPLLWFAYSSFQAALHNCMLISGWYVAGP